MTKSFLNDLPCWMEHMALDPDTGLDPEGRKLRAADGSPPCSDALLALRPDNSLPHSDEPRIWILLDSAGFRAFNSWECMHACTARLPDCSCLVPVPRHDQSSEVTARLPRPCITPTKNQSSDPCPATWLSEKRTSVDDACIH